MIKYYKVQFGLFNVTLFDYTYNYCTKYKCTIYIEPEWQNMKYTLTNIFKTG